MRENIFVVEATDESTEERVWLCIFKERVDAVIWIEIEEKTDNDNYIDYEIIPTYLF